MMAIVEYVNQTTANPAQPGYGLEAVYSLSLEQYERMVTDGTIAAENRVELLNGILVTKKGKNPPHSLAHYAIEEAIRKLMPPAYWLRHEEPIRITPNSEPEPDLSLVRGSPSDYGTRHPGARDVALVVEISDSSLPRDRGGKWFLYAGAAIPSFWILNLVDRRVEVYSEPSSTGYGRCELFGPGGTIRLIIDGVELGVIEVDELLPPN